MDPPVYYSTGKPGNPYLSHYCQKYVVTVTRRNTITNIISSAQMRVVIIDEKAKFIPSITDICRNKTVNFATIGIDSSNINKYTWDYGDGTPRYTINNRNYFLNYGKYLNGNTSHTYTDAGTYFVKLIIEDKLGCLDSFQYAIPIVVKGPVPGFEATPLPPVRKNSLPCLKTLPYKMELPPLLNGPGILAMAPRPILPLRIPPSAIPIPTTITIASGMLPSTLKMQQVAKPRSSPTTTSKAIGPKLPSLVMIPSSAVAPMCFCTTNLQPTTPPIPGTWVMALPPTATTRLIPTASMASMI